MLNLTEFIISNAIPRQFILVVCCLFFHAHTFAQTQPISNSIASDASEAHASSSGTYPQYKQDSLDISPAEQERIADIQKKYHNPYRFNVTQLIVPASLIAVGTIGLSSDWLRNRNRDIRNESTHYVKKKFTMDDYAQYVPFLSVYALNLCGVKGKHNFIDRSIILATAYAIMGASVNITKNLVNEWRPDGSSCNSFPSGHTATAFMGATFLWLEYRDTSVWYGVGGFTLATATGFFRMYNNRHWLTDIIAGAGVGILSTKAAYWIYPPLHRLFFKNKKNGTTHLTAMPFYDAANKGAGLACSLTF